MDLYSCIHVTRRNVHGRSPDNIASTTMEIPQENLFAKPVEYYIVNHDKGSRLRFDADHIKTLNSDLKVKILESSEFHELMTNELNHMNNVLDGFGYLLSQQNKPT